MISDYMGWYSSLLEEKERFFVCPTGATFKGF